MCSKSIAKTIQNPAWHWEYLPVRTTHTAFICQWKTVDLWDILINLSFTAGKVGETRTTATDWTTSASTTTQPSSGTNCSRSDEKGKL